MLAYFFLKCMKKKKLRNPENENEKKNVYVIK